MLCLETRSEHGPFIEVECDDVSERISILSDCEFIIDIDSSCDNIINVESWLDVVVNVNSDNDGFAVIESLGELINVFSELSKDLFVWSDNNGVIDIESSSDTIYIDSDVEGTIKIESSCALDKMGLSSMLDDLADVYSSYVCRVNTKGYLIIEGRGGLTDPPLPITIFISDKFVNSVNVYSDLRWIIN